MLKKALLLAVCALAASACVRSNNKWTPPETTAQAKEAKPSDKRIVLFAPTNLGPLAAIYPEARLDFPYDMAQRIDLLVQDADGQVGETLPDSLAPEWGKGRVPTAAGADVVVLTSITDLKTESGGRDVHGAQDNVVATVELQVLDVNGNTIFARKASGVAEVPKSPKLMSEASLPESRAAWQGLTATLAALRTYLEEQRSLSNVPHKASDKKPEAGTVMVDFVIDSQPNNADVLIDGKFRGTTPQRMHLPNKTIKVRIERQGYVPWEREIVPDPDVRIQPALEPVKPEAGKN